MSPPAADRRRSFFRIAGGVLATGVALVSYRYLVGVGPQPSSITSNHLARPWLYLHVAGAATALLIGSAQFSGSLRSRWPASHRLAGAAYVSSCLIGGSAGFVLAFGSTAGPIASGGFATLGLLWVSITAQGLRSALLGRFEEHRAWMTRSWGLTLSAVTLRLYLAVVPALGVDFLEAYRWISWLCWVPNLLLAELWLAVFRTRGLPVHA